MALSKDKLLKPRWKVIADYPASMHLVGDVLSAYDNGVRYLVKIEDASEKYSMNDYPHLFQKLQWWEERKVEEMPEHIKCENAVRRFKQIREDGRIELYDYPGEIEYEEIIYEKMDGKGYELYFIEECEPATLEEYTHYINKNKQAS